MLALYIALGCLGYTMTGYWWGRASWKVWEEKQRSAAGLLCFPVSYYTEDGVGSCIIIDGDLECSPISWFGEREYYARAMMFTWPLKLLWNLTVITGLAVWESPKVVLLPKHIYLKMFPVKAPPKELPAAESEVDPDRFDIDEYNALRARLDKLEAHPDKEKILAQGRRF